MFYSGKTLIRFWLFIILIASYSVTNAQTGPAGVGSANGSSSLDLWLKGNQGITKQSGNDKIKTWNDQSGNSRDFSKGSSAPGFSTNAINGFNAIKFDGNGDELIDSDGNNYVNGLGAFTVFYILKSDQTNSDRGFINADLGDQKDDVFTFRYDKNGYDGGGTNLIKGGILNDNKDHRIESSSNVQTTSAQLVTFHWNSGNPLELFIDGGSSNSLSHASNNPSGSISNTNNLVIGKGAKGGSGSSWDGLVGEVIIFNSQLNKVERIIVHNYLSAKYDISLSSNDKYAGDKNSNSDYDRGVIGIGKTNSKSHAHSKNDGLAIQNNTVLDNGDYLLAGHKIETNSVNNTDLGGVSNLDGRWERTWYIDKTDNGSTLKVDLTFDLSEGGFPNPSAGPASDYILLHRSASTNNGGWSSAGTADNVKNGDEIAFNNIDVKDGHEYTIGTMDESNAPLPVELLFFRASEEENSVRLNWATASETNNSHFVVQKRVDHEWQPIGKVDGNGTTMKQQEYSFNDDNINKEVSRYYRLKQVDFDGSFEFSNIEDIKVEQNNFEGITLYPVPASDVINLKLNTDQSGEKDLTIRQMDGQTIYKESIYFSIARSKQTIPVNSLEPGTYLLYIKGKEKHWKARFIKQN